jgi:hypothetical protein
MVSNEVKADGLSEFQLLISGTGPDNFVSSRAFISRQQSSFFAHSLIILPCAET